VIDNTGHRLTNGFLLPDFQSTDAGLDVEIEYSFFDHLSLSLRAPYIFARYRGPSPNPANPPLDSCRCWHSGLQDFGISARYNAISGRTRAGWRIHCPASMCSWFGSSTWLAQIRILDEHSPRD